MNKTLEQLENDYWGEPEFESHLVKTCHRLRRKPIDDFTVEDLRIMIGQNIGLTHLLAFAMDILRDNPTASGDFYEGDLLKAIIECDVVQQDKDEGLRGELAALCIKAIKQNASNELHEQTKETSREVAVSSSKSDALLLQLKIDELKTETPWREFSQFSSKFGQD